MDDIVIYGAGGFAREVAWLAEETGIFHVRAFISDDDAEQGKVINDLQVVSLGSAQRDYPSAAYVVAVGSPALREKLAHAADEAGFEAAVLVDPEVRQSRFNQLGPGTVVTAGNILTTNIRLHRHVQINLDCTIGHDVIMEDFVTLAPGVHVSGFVRIGKGAYLGTGAVVINGSSDVVLQIGEGAVVGAGAVVTKSIPAGVTAVGVPARWKSD